MPQDEHIQVTRVHIVQAAVPHRLTVRPVTVHRLMVRLHQPVHDRLPLLLQIGDRGRHINPGHHPPHPGPALTPVTQPSHSATPPGHPDKPMNMGRLIHSQPQADQPLCQASTDVAGWADAPPAGGRSGLPTGPTQREGPVGLSSPRVPNRPSGQMASHGSQLGCPDDQASALVTGSGIVSFLVTPSWGTAGQVRDPRSGRSGPLPVCRVCYGRMTPRPSQPRNLNGADAGTSSAGWCTLWIRTSLVASGAAGQRCGEVVAAGRRCTGPVSGPVR